MSDGHSKAAIARARSLTRQQRSDIARNAAVARWEPQLPQAQFGSSDRPLKIGELEIPCYVLSDGRRVLTQSGVLFALGMSRGGGSGDGDRLGSFVRQKAILPFISDKLMSAIDSPIKFKIPTGGSYALGYEAEILVDVCDAVLSARAAGGMHNRQQAPIALRCEILVRAFSKIGIIALVDEATGYQESRDKKALQAILDQYLRKELAAWAKRFPDDFYRQIFRLRDWEWRGMKVGTPRCLANYTKDIVYERLAPGLLDELEKRNPISASGRRKGKHHQLFTDDVGHPALTEHLVKVVTLMKVSKNWEQFLNMLNFVSPKKGENYVLDFMTEEVAAGRL